MYPLLRDAMEVAHIAHAGQVRKYTGAPYITHPAEVVGYVSIIGITYVQALGWVHDVLEDTDYPPAKIVEKFGESFMVDLLSLTDCEVGNRAARVHGAGLRLQKASFFSQSTKCGDIVSNVRSIAVHDPKFGLTYCDEKEGHLHLMDKSHPYLRQMAYNAVHTARRECQEALLQLSLKKMETAT